jgi:hypothetical protein
LPAPHRWHIREAEYRTTDLYAEAITQSSHLTPTLTNDVRSPSPMRWGGDFNSMPKVKI